MSTYLAKVVILYLMHKYSCRIVIFGGFTAGCEEIVLLTCGMFAAKVSFEDSWKVDGLVLGRFGV